ncbi:glycosyltransferase [Gracilibacillus alcaliphilus]|uniref:glycosyltransferase n=1 Tax=Gracilibacillus alcaliphilus TaxID=1401441 RepID=UPI0019593302|nr:glycosyltransferase [Gracilibacillus alcaliphilus]MBM7678451.1 hypothetical protein [Gracilibacillus alcaliphilus]
MKVLIVSPYFPPYQSVAVVRISSLVRHLIQKEFQVTVLTNKLSSTEIQNISNFKFENVKKYYVDISRNQGEYFKNKKSYEKIFRRLMEKNNYDRVIITCGPYYTVPLCTISEKDYNTKCIIDYRDLWLLDIRNMRDFLHPKNIFKKIIFFPIEARAFFHSHKIITVTEGWAKTLKKMYPFFNKKIKVVYNGYDDTYLKEAYISNENASFIETGRDYNLMIFGKLSYYSKEYSNILFKAVKGINANHNNLNIVQVGLEESVTRSIINELNFNTNNFISTGFLDYADGIKELKSANVTVIIDIRKRAIGTKIYDYVYVNKPIIYIGKKNTYLSNFVSKFEHGYSCNNEKDLIHTLNYLIENKITYLTKTNTIDLYSRSYQNNEFEKYIKG